MRPLNLKHRISGWQTRARFYKAGTHPNGFDAGPGIEISDFYLKEGRNESVTLFSANQCRALSDWLLKAASELERKSVREVKK